MGDIVSRLKRKRSGRNVVRQFGDEYGLVYFGYVDQFHDEHSIVRGMTMSQKHHDDFYSVGSYEHYDVMYVQRSDTLSSSNGTKKPHSWQIMSFDLHTSRELPHVFIGLPTHSETFYNAFFTKYPSMRLLAMNTFAAHSAEFLNRHRVFGRPVEMLFIEHIFSPQLDDTITRHFAGLAIEISENTLYLYSERARPTHQLLDAMIKNGTWLAGHIDTVSKSLEN